MLTSEDQLALFLSSLGRQLIVEYMAEGHLKFNTEIYPCDHLQEQEICLYKIWDFHAGD
jgi:hypothetical protein